MESYCWMLNPQKFLSRDEAAVLLATAKERSERADSKGQVVAIRDYLIVHLALTTGLRVMEIAALNCGDIVLDGWVSSLFVRCGKGSRCRQVLFSGAIMNHLVEYLKWKQRRGEATVPDQPLLVSSYSGSYMTTRAIQKAFKRCAGRAHLADFYSIHCLRHTYACFLLKASNWNLRFVQKQLGHSRITTTQIYADILMPDVKRALDRLMI